LRLIALKQHDFDGEVGLLVKISPHALPDADYLRIICDGTNPDRSAHDCFSPKALKQRNSQNSLADEFAQHIASRCHDRARMGIAE